MSTQTLHLITFTLSGYYYIPASVTRVNGYRCLWGKHYSLYLPWFCMVLPPGDFTSYSIKMFWVWKLAQVENLCKRTWLPVKVAYPQSCICIFIFFWLYISSNTIVDCQSILPPGIPYSINHLPSLLGSPSERISYYSNCSLNLLQPWDPLIPTIIN